MHAPGRARSPAARRPLRSRRGARAARTERGVALVIGCTLREVRLGRSQLSFRAGDLKFEVLRIEPRNHISSVHPIADIDDPHRDLAGDAEAEIGFVARPHYADELTA